MTHKPVDKEFTLKTHTYTQIKREGDFAIYTQRVTNDPTAAIRYEVVRIGRHNGYTLGGATIAPAETYPGASQWGINGFTCLTMEAAEKRFEKMKLDNTPVVVDGVEVKKRKGKQKMDVKITIPAGKFSAKEFAESCKVDYSLGALRMRELISKGEIKFVEEKRINPRGKATKFYIKAK